MVFAVIENGQLVGFVSDTADAPEGAMTWPCPPGLDPAEGWVWNGEGLIRDPQRLLADAKAERLRMIRTLAANEIAALQWRIERAEERDRLGLPGETVEEVLLEREAIRRASNRCEAEVEAALDVQAVAASQNARAAIRQSSTAISAINASSQALDILYNAATKFTYVGGGWSANPATLVTGNFLLVRVRQTANQYGWGDGMTNSQYIRIGGSSWTATNGQSTNNLVNRTTLPHVYDNALRPVNDTTIQYYLYNSYEIAYLAA